ncbi:amidohydrolase family protein [Adhaeribacter rhizoryzae]|uniref:Amidohydrolase family protein n=1 Tax=Adhaeribacter rhizoryzae TaxID=2607907 RepID=A0A5M6DGI4_9BACT|nr:amidohydrolase family protein [Adhaeribacter rhizoryzae]KAA5546621.1 amidohydrolase family protein [Adhaeribacter rhizoryzae]
MHIDAHQHFWQYSPSAYDWIDATMQPLQQDFLPEHLAPLLQQNGFSGSVAVQALQTEAETEFLLNLATQHDFIKGVVGWTDLQAVDVETKLAKFSQNLKLKGLRHVVQAEPDDQFLLRPDFLRGISLLQKFNLTYDILIYPKHLPVATEFVSKFPDQPFVLDHIAKPFIKNHQLLPWAQHIQKLANHSNVYCKLSGMVTEADWHYWQPTDFKPYLDVVMEAFGPDRLMIGSDWPVCTLAGSYTEVMNLVKDYINQLTQAEREKILGSNAVQFYKL